MNIREASFHDIDIWLELRTKLWPDDKDQHRDELDKYFNSLSTNIQQAYIMENQARVAVGFIELNIREYAEGSQHNQVPYVEGWYVDTPFQNKGYGKQLMQMAEQWAKQQGFNELASDTEVTNTRSIAIHKQLGFAETERVVCFLKPLENV